MMLSPIHPFILTSHLSSSLSQLHSFSWPAYKKLLGATGGEAERQSKETAQAALAAKLAAIQEVRVAYHVTSRHSCVKECLCSETAANEVEVEGAAVEAPVHRRGRPLLQVLRRVGERKTRSVSQGEGIHSYRHIHTYIHVYIYICMYVCPGLSRKLEPDQLEGHQAVAVRPGDGPRCPWPSLQSAIIHPSYDMTGSTRRT